MGFMTSVGNGYIKQNLQTFLLLAASVKNLLNLRFATHTSFQRELKEIPGF